MNSNVQFWGIDNVECAKNPDGTRVTMYAGSVLNKRQKRDRVIEMAMKEKLQQEQNGNFQLQ
jgi:hypothetical protein